MLNALKQKRAGSSAQQGDARAASAPELKTWYQDRYQTITVQRNVLFIITVLALFGLGFSVTAVATLNASKTFEPFVITVEDKTGIVTQVDQRTLEKYKADESITRYFLVKYLLARESYNPQDYRYFYYRVVRLLSSGQAYGGFTSGLSASNPDSPINLGQERGIKVDIKSISFLEKKKVQIRFVARKYSLAGGASQEDKEEHYIATLNYDFLNLDLSQEDRYINPIGFQVTGYRRDRETLQ